MLLAKLAHTPIPASVVLLLRALGLRINFSQRRSDRNVRDAFHEVNVVKDGGGEIQRARQVGPDVRPGYLVAAPEKLRGRVPRLSRLSMGTEGNAQLDLRRAMRALAITATISPPPLPARPSSSAQTWISSSSASPVLALTGPLGE